MKSAPRGQNTSDVEVGNVSAHGLWLLIGDRERFWSFKEFPWFRDATIGQLTNVQLPSPHHLLYWPNWTSTSQSSRWITQNGFR